MDSKKDGVTAGVFALFFMCAYFGKYLKHTENINPKSFFAEVLLSIAGCGLSYYVGVGQGFDLPNFMIFGIGCGLGYIQIGKFVMQQCSASKG